MIRVTFLFAFVFSICFITQAQINPHAIGLRLASDNEANGAELSYQHGLGDANRLEFDLGLGAHKNHNNMFLAGIYHWVWNINGGLNWYAGPGAALGFHDHNKNSDDHFSLALGGQIGIEFDFNSNNAPILLSVDARPMWDFIGDTHNLGYGTALSIRYTW
ncbi:MAG: hypothetical protein JXR19_09360 [Bacteroidia bacterium]